MSTVSGVAVLGSTGSIGTTALRVLARHPDRFRVTALTAHRNQALLAAQVSEWMPSFTGLVDPENGALLPGWGCGTDCLIAAATAPDTDIVLNAVVGAAGLDATLAALHAGKRVALANKESLVVAGALVLDALAQPAAGKGKPATGQPGGHDGHAEIEATIVFRCEEPAQLRALEVKLFDRFPGVKRIDAQVVSAQGQKSVQLSAAARRLAW